MGALSLMRRKPAGAARRTTPMSPEIYTIVGAAIALAGLILSGQRLTANSIAELRRDLNALSDRVHRDIAGVNGDIAALSDRVNGDIAALSDRVNRDIAALGERVSRVEGLLEGIRDTIGDRAA